MDTDTSPRSLIVTFFGAYGRGIGGWIAVADLITLMARLGVDPPSVRSSVSRLKRRGLLEARPVGGAAGYSLSERARRILADGDRRIYERRAASLSDGWVMAVFSVPESERGKRHVLRSRLAWLGFGTVTPGVWIAPAHLYDEARRTLEQLGLACYVELFRSDYLAFADLREAVSRWWDLDALEKGYEEFIAAYEPILRRRAGPAPRDDAEAFRDYLPAVDAWRRMPYLDPGLPAELVPPDWSGTRAANVFFALHARLHEPGLRHVKAITGASAGAGWPARPP